MRGRVPAPALVRPLAVLARRWPRSGPARSVRLARRDRAAPPAGVPASDQLILAFAQLCRMLDRPFALAEIRAAAPAADGAFAVGGILLAAERLGFKARALKPSRHNLAGAPPPFLVAGRVPGEAWLATGRCRIICSCSSRARADHGVQPGGGGRSRGADRAGEAARRARRRTGWRDTMLARLRPVLWELGIASVVINLLALATPLFLMTVYNKVINHGALQTLDVLVFGMVTLFLFEWALRALRGYVASHTGGRLDAALGSEVVHHLVHLPLRTFERMATGQILERTRQLDSIRQFFASQMPLLLVDLAFVGLFLGVICYLDLRLGAITLAAMPLFWLLSMLARRRHHGLIEAGFKAAAAKASSLGETISQALTVKALGLEPEMERPLQAAPRRCRHQHLPRRPSRRHDRELGPGPAAGRGAADRVRRRARSSRASCRSAP